MAEAGILDPEAQVDKGENARMASFVGAIAIADLVKTTLGPRGMDKILQSVHSKDKDLTITNDGATILRSIHIDNAAAKVLVDISKTQDSEVGDGTTSVAVLCGELLREAEKLIAQRIHPQTIIEGWRIALKLASEALVANAKDNGAAGEEAAFREDLMNIARTTLSSKLLTHEKDHFASLLGAFGATEATQVPRHMIAQPSCLALSLARSLALVAASLPACWQPLAACLPACWHPRSSGTLVSTLAVVLNSTDFLRCLRS